MDAGSVAGSGTLNKFAAAAVKLANDSTKTQGKAAARLLQDSGQVVHNANRDPAKGRIIDTHA